MEDFKISIAAARVNAKKKQEEVAKALHVSKQTVGSWENGKTSPTIEKAMELCRFFNIPYDRVSFLRESNTIK